MDLTCEAEEKLNEFLSPYEDLFDDKRLDKRFKGTVQGIIGAESPKVMKIAAFFPDRQENASSTAKGIYRFLGNDELSEQELLRPLYEETKEDFRNEKNIIGVIDLSPWEKPYARKMEGLSKVEKKDKSGTVNGYMAVSVLLIRIELAWGRCIWKVEALYLLRSQIVWVEGMGIEVFYTGIRT